MKQFLKILLSGSDQVSSRRLIALLTLPFYLMSIFVGVFHNDFRYFLASMIASSIPIMMAFYKLGWRDVIKILDTKVFKKNDDFGITEDQLKDP